MYIHCYNRFYDVNGKTINTIFTSLLPMPTDPVCGIELDYELSVNHEHNGKTYFFCCEGCKRIFTKKPKKYA